MRANWKSLHFHSHIICFMYYFIFGEFVFPDPKKKLATASLPILIPDIQSVRAMCFWYALSIYRVHQIPHPINQFLRCVFPVYSGIFISQLKIFYLYIRLSCARFTLKKKKKDEANIQCELYYTINARYIMCGDDGKIKKENVLLTTLHTHILTYIFIIHLYNL